MKRKISLIVLTALLTLTFGTHVSAAPLAAPIRVLVNDTLIKFPDAQPFIDNSNRTQVPARFVSEALGADVAWDEGTRMVTIKNNTDIVTLKIGERAITVNGVVKQLDTEATINRSRTFVPLRFVSEALGAGVTWEAPTMTASITTKQVVELGATEVCKGYTIPLGTKLGYHKDGFDTGENTEQTFFVNFLLPDPEAQKIALRSAIASKFGDAIGTEVYNHVLPKKVDFDDLPKKMIYIEATNQYIQIPASGGASIELYIFRPGKDPSNLSHN